MERIDFKWSSSPPPPNRLAVAPPLEMGVIINEKGIINNDLSTIAFFHVEKKTKHDRKLRNYFSSQVASI